MNPLRRVVINVDPYKSTATSTVGDDACDIPKPIRYMSSNREADQFLRRVRRFKLGVRSEELPNDATSIVGEGCSPLGRRHEVTVGDSPVRGNVRKEDKRVAVLA